MTKGTPSRGKFNKGAPHQVCRRCGRRAMHIQNKVCASCGFGRSPRIAVRRWKNVKDPIER